MALGDGRGPLGRSGRGALDVQQVGSARSLRQFRCGEEERDERRGGMERQNKTQQHKENEEQYLQEMTLL